MAAKELLDKVQCFSGGEVLVFKCWKLFLIGEQRREFHTGNRKTFLSLVLANTVNSLME